MLLVTKANVIFKTLFYLENLGSTLKHRISSVLFTKIYLIVRFLLLFNKAGLIGVAEHGRLSNFDAEMLKISLRSLKFLRRALVFGKDFSTYWSQIWGH